MNSKGLVLGESVQRGIVFQMPPCLPCVGARHCSLLWGLPLVELGADAQDLFLGCVLYLLIHIYCHSTSDGKMLNMSVNRR